MSVSISTVIGSTIAQLSKSRYPRFVSPLNGTGVAPSDTDSPSWKAEVTCGKVHGWLDWEVHAGPPSLPYNSQHFVSPLSRIARYGPSMGRTPGVVQKLQICDWCGYQILPLPSFRGYCPTLQAVVKDGTAVA